MLTLFSSSTIDVKGAKYESINVYIRVLSTFIFD
jgi:hypothetical protein